MSLFEAFDALKLPDGRPDLSSRRLCLNNLIPLLKKSEIFQIRFLIDNVRLNWTGNELFSKLPTELCQKILDDLDLEDLLRLRSVCQSWYHEFCKIEICSHIINKYFPLPIDYYYKKSGSNCTELGKNMKKKDWLQRFIINRIRREHGISSKSFELDARLFKTDQTWTYRYFNGRMASLVEHEFVVEDLMTRQQSTFPCNQPIRYVKWHLSDQYLIILYEHHEALSYELVAWNLDSGNLFTTQLSEKARHISAYQNRVAIITTSSRNETEMYNLYTWDLKNPVKFLREIKIDVIDEQEEIVAINIFLHVLEQDKIFFVYQTRINYRLNHIDHATRLTVQCFEAGALVQTQHETVETSLRPCSYECFSITNDGIICFDLSEDPDFRRGPYKHITYDMNRRKFTTLEIYIPQPFKSKRDYFSCISFIWRDQLHNQVRIHKALKMHVITLSKSLTDIWNGLEPRNDRLNQSSSPSSILCGEVRSPCKSIKSSHLDLLVYGSSKITWGDDSFLIMSFGKTLKVWQFDDLGLEPSREILSSIN